MKRFFLGLAILALAVFPAEAFFVEFETEQGLVRTVINGPPGIVVQPDGVRVSRYNPDQTAALMRAMDGMGPLTMARWILRGSDEGKWRARPQKGSGSFCIQLEMPDGLIVQINGYDDPWQYVTEPGTGKRWIWYSPRNAVAIYDELDSLAYSVEQIAQVWSGVYDARQPGGVASAQTKKPKPKDPEDPVCGQSYTGCCLCPVQEGCCCTRDGSSNCDPPKFGGCQYVVVCSG